MSDKLRIASFNVQNLFGRARVLNFRDHSIGDNIFVKIDEFRSLLKKDPYTVQDKQKIVDLFNQELKDFIVVREDRGKLFKKSGWSVIGIDASGCGDWDGAIEFKQAKFSDVARENTAKVIKAVKADVACIVEAESRPSLRRFDTHLLGSSYEYDVLMDANDPRGIDVGLYSKYPIGGIWTHMFDKQGNTTIFSRDCLDVEVLLPNKNSLHILCNHFKSRGYDYEGKADEKRETQAQRVAQILREQYDLKKDWVIIAGDLNDNPSSQPLQPLLNDPNLTDVLGMQFPANPEKCWTYHYQFFEQIDYILVSKALSDRFLKAGVERRGIYKLKSLTTAANGVVEIEEEFKTVTHWTNAASDHGAVWAEFDLS